jgi:hypothetical protein
MKRSDEKNFTKWCNQLDRYMMKKYALSIELSDWDGDRLRRHYNDGDTPKEAVEFYAEKFDFVSPEDFLAYR